MKSFLLIELEEKGICHITHAYLREGEKLPFDWDKTIEEWYRAEDNLIIIQDSWGEFIPLTISSPTGLKTNAGEEIIVFEKITPLEKEALLEEFYLTGQ